MLAKAAARAMEEEQVIGPDGPETPNAFEILLNPADFRQFAPYRASLETKIARYLDRTALERGLRPVASWRVELREEEGVRPHSVRVRASMADVEPPRRDTSRATEVEDGRTTPFEALDGAAGRGSARLVCEDGRSFVLSDEVTAIGRALENDVVVPDTRVSRFHAEIHRTDQDFLVRDLKSTNGTLVAGRRVQERRLAHGDRISLGGYGLVFRQ